MRKWLKLIFVIICFAVTSVILFYILKACGIANISTLKSLILKSGDWAVLVYILVSIIVLVAFCFVPLLNTALIIFGIAIFGSKITFIAVLISVFFSTTILFFIGDKVGEKFAIKLVGEKSLKEAQNLIDTKSKILLPIFFILPCIPDEALCLVAGMTKMKYWYLILVSMIYHTIEIGLFCFLGSGIINWSSLSVVDWIILINVLVFDFYFLFKLEKHFKSNNKQN